MEQKTVNGICVISTLVTHHTGGVQRQILLQTREFARVGLKTFVLQRNDPYITQQISSEWRHSEIISAKTFESHLFILGRFLKLFNPLLFILDGLLKFRKISHQVDIVHAHQASSAALLAVLIKFFFKKPVVVKATSGGAWGEIQQMSRQPSFWLRRRILQGVDRWIALTEAMKTELMHHFKIPEGQITVLPNGVSLSPHQDLAARKNIIFEILYCGRLSIEKRLDTLIVAADLLSHRLKKKICVNLLGPVFQLRNPSLQLSDIQNKFSSQVEIKFLGERNDTEIYYRSANVFVLPSESEGMSNALLEAMSFGVPCIVSDIVENRALIHPEENGLVFPVGDAAVLCDQLWRIYKDQYESDAVLSLALRNKARSLIQAKYSASAICEALMSIYQGLKNYSGSDSSQCLGWGQMVEKTSRGENRAHK
jgi:glycosyltransferase involved in cell wall biosynthesis